MFEFSLDKSLIIEQNGQMLGNLIYVLQSTNEISLIFHDSPVLFLEGML